MREREAPVPVNAHPFAALCVLEGRGERKREREGGAGARGIDMVTTGILIG